MHAIRHPGRLQALGVLLLAAGLACCADPTPGFVDDPASLLDGDRRQRIESLHRALEEDLGIRFHLAILDEPAEDLPAAAVDLYARKLPGDNGLLLLVDPHRQRVRLEVGYGLEAVYTDAFVGYVEREQMAPFFAGGRVGDGVEATVELLVARALPEMDAVGAPGPPAAHHSGGAGAEISMPPGGANGGAPAAPDAGRFLPQPTPGESLRIYAEILAGRVRDPSLPIYTEGTRRFLSGWLVTDAQQRKDYEGLRKHWASAEERISGGRAVVRFPVAERAMAPYFFRASEAGWQLDLESMHRLIRFNHLNQWHFTENGHEFMFAFADHSVDANGYVH